MRWFDQASMGAAERAKFQDLSPAKNRVPSWLPGRGDRRADGSSLRPPRLPSEFVEAVRHEVVDHEYAARKRNSLPAEPHRRSDFPSASVLPGSAPLNAAVSAPRIEMPAPAPDPALVQGFQQAILLLFGERERVMSEAAAELAELAVLIARRVIGRELSLDATVVQGLVQEGMEALGQHDRVLVRIGKGFGTACEQLEQELRDEGGRSEVRVDPALDDYGCIVETELGRVDESVEARLETLLQALRPDSNPP